MSSNSSVAIIGGADGPTSIFVAGTIDLARVTLTAFGAVLAVMLVLWLALYRTRIFTCSAPDADGAANAKAPRFLSPCRIVCLALTALAVVVSDQYVKFMTQLALALDETAKFLPNLLQFRRVHNYGAAWSSLSGARWLLIILTGIGMTALAWLLVKIVRHPLGQWSLAMVIGGGVGNLIDRVRLGYVIDMLDVQFMSFPVFNVADCFVVVGTFLALIYYLKFYPLGDEKNWENADGKDVPHNN